MHATPARAAAACLALALLALLAHRALAPRPMQRELFVFGSVATIEVVAGPASARAALSEIERRLNLRHREWHPWEASELTSLNAALARGQPHRAADSLIALIEASRPLVAASGGRFDPGAGALVALWGFHTSEYPVRLPPPDDAAITRLVASRPSLLQLRLEHGVVSSPNRAVQLDFNAVAEGMATREVVTILAAHGIDDALVALGGDVHARGSRAGRPWRVALRDPGEGTLGVVRLAGGESLYASGGYGRYRERDGARLPHVLDPRSGRPVHGAIASAVLAADPVRADAAATALLVAGPREWWRTARAMGIACALIVDGAGTVHVTEAMHARLEWTTARRIERVERGASPGRRVRACAAHRGSRERERRARRT